MIQNLKNILALSAIVTLVSNCASDDGATATEPDSNVITCSGTTSVADGGTLSGTQTQCVEVAADATVTFSGTVKFPSGTQLTVNEGATIKFETSSLSYLIIAQGAKIVASGTSAKPIVFTSGNSAGSRAPQNWGGLVINGYATLNTGSTADGEGDSGTYGGTNDLWNCGTLRYVRVEFAGKVFTANDELNGIAMQGCGSQTTMQYVQAHKNSDDGIEFFGGVVNPSYIVLTENQDDNLDWTSGYRGTISNVVTSAANSDTCIEADSNSTSNTATPVATVSIDKYTCIRNDNTSGDPISGKRGVRIREGTAFTLSNAYINGGGGEMTDKCITGEDSASSVTATSNILIEECGSTGHANDSTDAAGTYNVTATVANAPATALLDKTSFTVGGLASAGSAAFKANASGTNASVTTGGASSTDTWLDNWTSFPAN